MRIAAKVDNADFEYYKTKIKRLLKWPGIEFVGEIGDNQKGAFLGDALALLFPIDWPEPFGLVMIEAMANGTPVIGFRRGSVPEIIDDGVTGFVVDSVDAALAVMPKVAAFDRRRVRRRFEERFSVERMAREYVALYDNALRAPQRKCARPGAFGRTADASSGLTAGKEGSQTLPAPARAGEAILALLHRIKRLLSGAPPAHAQIRLCLRPVRSARRYRRGRRQFRRPLSS